MQKSFSFYKVQLTTKLLYHRTYMHTLFTIYDYTFFVDVKVCTFYLVPVPDNVNIAVISTQTAGQPLTLECNVTTVKGITSRVDIVWSSNGLELKRIKGTNISYTSESSEIYTGIYNAMQLNTSDDGRVFHCEVIVNTSPLLFAYDNITLDVTG